MTLGEILAAYIIGVPLAAVAFYVVSRAASLGWHKSKLEHFLEQLRHISKHGGDDRDGI